MLERHCFECHGGEKLKGGVSLKGIAVDVKSVEAFALWEKVRETVAKGEMPPAKSKPLPAGDQQRLLDWVSVWLETAAAVHAGDPGPVTMRRLTRVEYENTLRDLTGRSLGLATGLPADAGGGEGFANTGDTLFVSASALDACFAVARKLAEHATILPGTGVVFHEHHVGLRGPEQVKAQTYQQLRVWYQQQAVLRLPGNWTEARVADHLLACWQHRCFQTPIEELAGTAGLKRAYLQHWWQLVNSTLPKSRFLDLTRVAWRNLPGPDATQPGQVPVRVRNEIGALTTQLMAWNRPAEAGSEVHRWLKKAAELKPELLTVPAAGQPWAYLCIGDLGDGGRGDIALVTKLLLRTTNGTASYLDWLSKQLAEDRKQPAGQPALQERITAAERVQRALGKHPQGRTIPSRSLALAAPQILALPLPEDALEVQAELSLDLKNPEVANASLQWTLVTGQPQEVTSILPGVAIIWDHRAEGAGDLLAEFLALRTALPEDFDRCVERVAANLQRTTPGRGIYYLSDDELVELLNPAERRHLAALRTDARLASGSAAAAQAEWDALLLQHLQEFASRAWRRPVSPGERQELESLYRASAGQGLDRESAAREVIVWTLVSPHFLFKAETLPVEVRAGAGELPLSDWELAARLSYFLWASLPDAELRQAADSGTVRQPAVLLAQAKRMLRTAKADALAKEFAGQWLKFSELDAPGRVDVRQFPDFTTELSADMRREAVEFFSHLIQEDRPVRDILAARYSFLNERLAKHYRVPGVTGSHFREVDLAEHHRGGLLGMGAILTKTSRPHRTSPVLRGDYLYQVVLGQALPPPPPDVPKLDEHELKPASVRELLQRHRAAPACAACHNRIDPLGFALESFDAIGRYRGAGEAGGPIDDTGELMGGIKLEGAAGLRRYFAEHEAPFLAQFARKLLGYALGRQVLPGDRALLTDMQASLGSGAGTFSTAVTHIVTSRQFMNRRNEIAVAPAAP